MKLRARKNVNNENVTDSNLCRKTCRGPFGGSYDDDDTGFTFEVVDCDISSELRLRTNQTPFYGSRP